MPLEMAKFLSLDLVDGWLKVDNDSFGKVLLEGASDARSIENAQPEDIIIEEDDEISKLYNFKSISEVYIFANKINEFMLEVK